MKSSESSAVAVDANVAIAIVCCGAFWVAFVFGVAIFVFAADAELMVEGEALHRFTTGARCSALAVDTIVTRCARIVAVAAGFRSPIGAAEAVLGTIFVCVIAAAHSAIAEAAAFDAELSAVAVRCVDTIDSVVGRMWLADIVEAGEAGCATRVVAASAGAAVVNAESSGAAFSAERAAIGSSDAAAVDTCSARTWSGFAAFCCRCDAGISIVAKLTIVAGCIALIGELACACHAFAATATVCMNSAVSIVGNGSVGSIRWPLRLGIGAFCIANSVAITRILIPKNWTTT